MAKDDDILDEARDLFRQCEEREADNRDEAGKTRHPLAGTLNCKRVIGDFLFMPTGIVLGVVVLGFSLSLALACAVVVFVVFVGSAFLMSTF